MKGKKKKKHRSRNQIFIFIPLEGLFLLIMKSSLILLRVINVVGVTFFEKMIIERDSRGISQWFLTLF